MSCVGRRDPAVSAAGPPRRTAVTDSGVSRGPPPAALDDRSGLFSSATVSRCRLEARECFARSAVAELTMPVADRVIVRVVGGSDDSVPAKAIAHTRRRRREGSAAISSSPYGLSTGPLQLGSEDRSADALSRSIRREIRPDLRLNSPRTTARRPRRPWRVAIRRCGKVYVSSVVGAVAGSAALWVASLALGRR